MAYVLTILALLPLLIRASPRYGASDVHLECSRKKPFYFDTGSHELGILTYTSTFNFCSVYLYGGHHVANAGVYCKRDRASNDFTMLQAGAGALQSGAHRLRDAFHVCSQSCVCAAGPGEPVDRDAQPRDIKYELTIDDSEAGYSWITPRKSTRQRQINPTNAAAATLPQSVMPTKIYKSKLAELIDQEFDYRADVFNDRVQREELEMEQRRTDRRRARARRWKKCSCFGGLGCFGGQNGPRRGCNPHLE